jgi:cysteine-rich repeat protein
VHVRFRSSLVLGALALSGCGLTLDLDPPPEGSVPDAGALDGGRDGGPVPAVDAGPPPTDAGEAGNPCEGEPDGRFCGSAPERRICLDERCVTSFCGDGWVDLQEDCEPPGEEDCQEDCRFECVLDSDCPTLPFSCLRAACQGRRCVPLPTNEGRGCDDLPDGVCRSGYCAPPSCGDGVLDAEEGEECDDGDTRGGDGCKPNCTPRCRSASDCSDRDPCNGFERCVPTTPSEGAFCVAGTAPAPLPCQRCLPFIGFVPVDEDGDGFLDAEPNPELCPEVDCDDADATVYPGAAESCDGRDEDCDGEEDEDVEGAECGPDRDGDGFPADDGLLDACDCPAGFVPVRRDADGPLFDCWDEPGVGALVFPGQAAFFSTAYCDPALDAGCEEPFDYDCDGDAERLLDARAPERCSNFDCDGGGWDGEVPACGALGVVRGCVAVLGQCQEREARRRQACR